MEGTDWEGVYEMLEMFYVLILVLITQVCICVCVYNVTIKLLYNIPYKSIYKYIYKNPLSCPLMMYLLPCISYTLIRSKHK